MEATNGLVLAGAPELPPGYFYRVGLDGEGKWRVQIRRTWILGLSWHVQGARVDRRGLLPTITEIANAAELAYRVWQDKLQATEEYRHLKGDYK